MAGVSVFRQYVALAALAACGSMVPAQTPANPGQSGAAQPAAKSTGVKHPHARKPRPAKLAAEPAPIVETRPPDPPPPDWPANAKAEPAAVGWNGHDLSIAATNSSLRQILQDISTSTGVKVEGIGNDQRIYGSYGPAPARDVLGQLLEGSGYNVLMVGDQGEGTPRELVLSSKAGHAGAQGQPGAAQPNQNGDEESAEDPEPPEPPEVNVPHRPFGMNPQQPGRTPQQMLQEMQQRQLQQQQQQPQPGTPPNN